MSSLELLPHGTYTVKVDRVRKVKGKPMMRIKMTDTNSGRLMQFDLPIEDNLAGGKNRRYPVAGGNKA